jgi:uncharacterized membrane protein
VASNVATQETLKTPAASIATTGRLESIDFVRGLVMVIMAIDHTRDYFTNLAFEPENLQRTWYALFFTRWITHFCAPLFFFLAGTGAYFYGAKRTPRELRRFLWTRGLWLAIVEFTIVGFAWTFVFPFGFFGVIWSLGLSMIVLSVAVRMPLKWLALLSVAVICLHDLADKVRPEQFGSWGWIWSVLHVKGLVNIFGWREFVLFPLAPWCAVMAAGYVFGALLQRSDRRVWMVRLGTAMTIAFLLLRLTNVYGNPPAQPGGVTPGDWHVQPTLEKTIILFLDTEKYPPSLQFLLMTLGPSLLLLGWLAGKRLSGWWQKVVAFGRVPMFFYVLHLYLIHIMAVAAAAILGQPYSWLLHGGFILSYPQGAYGHNLPFIYLMWAIAVLLLYFPCARFAALKQRRRDWWLSYL